MDNYQKSNVTIKKEFLQFISLNMINKDLQHKKISEFKYLMGLYYVSLSNNLNISPKAHLTKNKGHADLTTLPPNVPYFDVFLFLSPAGSSNSTGPIPKRYACGHF